MLDHQLEPAGAIMRVQHDGTTLRVHYSAGGIYDYEDVSDELVSGLIHAESPARYMLHRIKDDRQAMPVAADAPFPPLAWD